MSEMFQELLSSNPYAIIELFELHLDASLHGTTEIVYFHPGANQATPTGNIIWKGKPYQALPIEVEGFEYNGTGQLPRPKVRVSNLLGNISALLLSVNEFTIGNDLTGAKVIRIRTLSRFLDPVNFTGGVNPYGTPADEEMPREIYYIDRKSVENRDVVEFELAAVFDLAGVRAPKRQVIANICQWKYRSAECGYTGSNYFDEYDNALGATPATNFNSTAFGAQLNVGETLNEGDAIVSSNGWYRALMQADGNFVVYNKANVPVWQTGTNRGDGTWRITMQADGNLVIYNGSTAFWASNTVGTASPTGLAFLGWYPTDVQTGRSGGFGWECVGSSPASAGLTNTQTETFNIDGRTITVQFVFQSGPTSENSYSGQPYAWNLIQSQSLVSSTGSYYQGEVINLPKTLSSNNPFRNNHPTLGTLAEAGPQYEITGVSGNSNNRLSITTTGQLIVTTGANTPLWNSSYASAVEPLVQTGTVDPLRDVCGKRISSCRKRFGEFNDLPFGSFPSAGTFYG
jgi:lambda family phage minor tail protein L